ncbi:CU044_5270 family protein [Spirillospora sp. NPDC048911]|uniref:CU044_5270 family protein n=1 Tax=Spirillospora sp. NPDC048911 TaxID=3364527 RepID=UPI00371A32E2
MSDDEITIFRDARPEVPPYEPAAKARARARLLDARAQRSRRSFRLPRLTSAQGLLAVGAATAVLVAGPTLLIKNLGKDDGPGRPGRSQVFGAGAAKDDRPRPGQWSYTKHLDASSSKGTGGALFGPPDVRSIRESWRSVDGKQTAFMEKGKLKTRAMNGVERRSGGGTSQAVVNSSPPSDYPYLLSLPAEPAALLAEIGRIIDKEYGREKPTAGQRTARTFEIMEIFLRDAALPLKQRSAMYGALRTLPGVKFEQKAADIAGRRGVTFYIIEEGYLRRETMFDPVTFQYLGFRAIAIRDHVNKALDGERLYKKGHILGWSGLIKVGFVDKPGQRL